MATLTGKRQRTVVDQIEIVMRDREEGEHVLVVTRDPSAKTTTISVRRPWEGAWDSSGGKATLTDAEANIVAAVVTGGDQGYRLDSLKAIDYSTYSAQDVNAKAVEAEVEARCSQLDIERAKAANIREEKEALVLSLTVQHMDDKHITRSVDGCPICELRYDYSDAAPAIQHEVVDSEF